VEAVLEVGGGEGVVNDCARFGKVLPSLEVDGDNGGLRCLASEADCFFRREGEMRVHDGDAGGSEEEDGEEDGREATNDFLDSAEPDGIAGDVDGVFRFVDQLEDEADDRAAIGIRGAVTRGCGGDANDTAIRRCDVNEVPILKACCISAELLCAGDSGDDALCGWKEVAPGAIKIVEVVMMAEEHGIDFAQIGWLQGRTGTFGQRHRTIGDFAPRWIEGWVGEESQACEFEEKGRASDIGEANRGRRGCHRGVSF